MSEFNCHECKFLTDDGDCPLNLEENANIGCAEIHAQRKFKDFLNKLGDHNK